MCVLLAVLLLVLPCCATADWLPDRDKKPDEVRQPWSSSSVHDDFWDPYDIRRMGVELRPREASRGNRLPLDHWPVDGRIQRVLGQDVLDVRKEKLLVLLVVVQAQRDQRHQFGSVCVVDARD